MNDTIKHCDLCRLPIEVPGFDLLTTEGPKQFCCEGCLGIYRMLNEESIVEASETAGGG